MTTNHDKDNIEPIKTTKYRTGITTVMYRRVSLNTDLVLFALIVSLFCTAGALFSQGFHFFEILGAILALVIGAIGIVIKLHIPKGRLATQLEHSGKQTLIQYAIKDNTDIVILTFCILGTLVFGITAGALFAFGWSWNVAGVALASLFESLSTGYAWIKAPQGDIRSKLSNKGRVKASSLDDEYRTII